MIRDITRSTLSAFQTSMLLSEMALPKTTPEAYESFRSEAATLLKEIGGFDDFEFPMTAEEMREREIEIIFNIMERLSLLRSRINGDVLPLTFFTLTYGICRSVFFIAFDFAEDWQVYRSILEPCFDDLGLDRNDEIASIELRARALKTVDESGRDFIGNRDRIEAVTDILQRIFDRVYDRWSSSEELADQVAGLFAYVKDFRNEAQQFYQESREEHQEILRSITDLRQELTGQLIAQGLSPAQAEAVADIESEGFLARLRRWAASDKARDALEAALWAALDFVPGGTGLKLGVKVAGAVRKSLKG